MKNKKLYIITLLSISLISLVLIFLQIKGNKTGSKPAQISPTYSIKSDYGGSFPINFNIKRDQIQPISLPYLNASKIVFKENYVREIAKNLGFKGDPQSFNDMKFGAVSFWSEGDRSLFVYPEAEKIHYYLNSFKDSVDKKITDVEIEKIASDFLIENGILKNRSLKKILISYWSKNPDNQGFKLTNRGAAVLFRVNFSQSEANYEILTPGNQQPLICIKILADGTIYDADVTFFSQISEGGTSFKLKDYNEIVKTIGDAKVSSLSNYQLLLADLPPTAIKKADIDKISIAYLLETEKSSILYPIYVLSGKADVEGYEKPFDIILYLPAISEIRSES